MNQPDRLKFPSRTVKSVNELIEKLETEEIKEIYFFFHHAFVPYSKLIVTLQRNLPFELAKLKVLKFLGDVMEIIDAARIFNTLFLLTNLDELCFSERLKSTEAWPKGFFTRFYYSLTLRSRNIKKITMFTLYDATLERCSKAVAYYHCSRILQLTSTFQIQITQGTYHLYAKYLLQGYERTLRCNDNFYATFGASSLYISDLHSYFDILKEHYAK